MLDCRFSSSESLDKIRKVLSVVCMSARRFSTHLESDYSNRLCASLMYYLKHNIDSSKQVCISMGELLNTIKQLKTPGPTLIQLTDLKLLFPTCLTLSSNGHLLFLKSEQKIKDSLLVLNEEVILSYVHSCLGEIKKCIDNNVGIVEESELNLILGDLLKQVMKPALAIDYLIIAQFCTKIIPDQLISNNVQHHTKSNSVHYFFPNLVQESKPIDLWTAEEHGYNKTLYTWFLKCAVGQFFTPRFLHTLFIQLVKFGIQLKNTKFVVWRNGIFLVAENGTRLTIDITEQTTLLQFTIQCLQGCESYLPMQRSELIRLIKSLKEKVCPKLKLNEYLLYNYESQQVEIEISEVASAIFHGHPCIARDVMPNHVKLLDLLLFDPFYMIKESDIELIFSAKDSEQSVSSDLLCAVSKAISANTMLLESLEEEAKSSQLTYRSLYKELHKYTIFPTGNLCELAGVKIPLKIIPSASPAYVSNYVPSLSPAVRSYLEYQLDWDNDVDRDLRQIAHHMLDWDTTLAPRLSLTEVSISDIKQKFVMDPELQRQEALKKWKNQKMLQATYRNLLQMFVDVGHTQSAEALCQALRNRCQAEKSTSYDFDGYVSSLPRAVRPHLEYRLDSDNDVDRDLREIAYHMLDWEVQLATPLELTEVDVRDIKEVHKEPELQRREVLKRWKDKLMHRATYGNLLQVFVDAGHFNCAKALCSQLEKKYIQPASSSDVAPATMPCKPKHSSSH